MTMRWLLGVGLLGVSVCCYAQQTDTTTKAVETEAAAKEAADTIPPGLPHIHAIEHRDVTYRSVNGVDLKLDVYEQPGGKAAPVIVYWHGGAWWKGERPKSGMKVFLDMGFAVVNVDYRLTDVAPAPAAVQDVRCSLAWVAKNADTYHFDAKRIVAYGTSAGGHLALMAGFLPAKNDIDAPECGPVPQVAAVLDFYGVPDFLVLFKDGVPLQKSLGRWLVAGPDQMKMAEKMQPNTYLRSGLPPVFIAHGDADPVVPYTESTELKKHLQELHVPVTMFTVPGGHHGGFPPDQTLLINEALIKFFGENGILAAAK